MIWVLLHLFASVEFGYITSTLQGTVNLTTVLLNSLIMRAYHSMEQCILV